ncbi:MAG: 50S ribosomal protein L6 [bacterium]|nr:50S ribosomal protein L6 [bacterium]
MSRVGNNPIAVPQTVNVEIEGQKVAVKGPLGELSLHCQPQLKVVLEDSQIIVKRKKEDAFSRSLHGLTRSLIANMVQGVEKGWEKKLELIGVGYRAQLNGEKLVLNVGFSHPVEVAAPEGIRFAVADNTKITVSGIDKSLVGQVAATIRKVRPPEPYQGKGIRYVGEYVRRKAGKAGKVGAGAK